MKKSKVGLVLKSDNKSWIIEKIAYRLQSFLGEFGFEAIIADAPLDNVDVNHHMSWAFANIKSKGPSTMFITHLDDIFKLRQVKGHLESYVDVGICMSNSTSQQMIDFGISAGAICFVPPAHDGKVQQRRIIIGITTRVYPDGRKREDLLVRLSRDLRLDAFEFKIFGRGWDTIIVKLREAGAKVEYFEESENYVEDYQHLLSEIPTFDYYLYLGMDEGSLGTLDALAAGVKTIITPQGFHLDIPNGITHPVVGYQDVLAVFSSISADHNSRIQGVHDLNWREYARRHSVVWHHLMNSGYGSNIQSLLFPNSQAAHMQKSHVASDSRYQLYRRALNPRRIVSALSHLPILRPLRSLLRKGK